MAHINRDPIDPYTLAHLGAGVAAGALHVPLPVVALAAVAWEVFEKGAKRRYPRWFPSPSPDSPQNALVDVGVAVAGAWIAGSVHRGRR